jgi:hypothetical protein
LERGPVAARAASVFHSGRMHISAYVPDGLWAAACAVHPAARPSIIARQAVEALIEAHADGPIRLDADQLRLTEAAIDRLRADAGQWAALGYRAGLQLAQSLEWWALDQIAGVGWTLAEMPSLSSWSMIRDDLRESLAFADAFSADLFAELGRPSPNLRRFSVFSDGVRSALATVSAPLGDAIAQQ